MRIAVLTSGGDAPGMNAAIRAVVRYCGYQDIEVFGINRGYRGLVEDDFIMLSKRSVSGIVQRGGTMLMTARCPEFTDYNVRKKAAENLSLRKIDGLVVIGGDGSFRGMNELYQDFGVKTVGIPGTIDNDLAYTDYTLGFDTAVNTVVENVNKLRDTMSSHERVVVVQVMGRRCGDIALYAGIASGAEIILIPEHKTDYDQVVSVLSRGKKAGKQSAIIMLAEGVGNVDDVINELKQRSPEMHFRSCVLGHIQRGGTPSQADRTLAARFGARAVELLNEGKGGRVVGIRDNKIIDMGVDEALSQPSNFDEKLFELARILSL
ncbi:MAG: 6-phosphofructokinase [Clostridia bacterium]|nr:6-phosphofructokinase [Clostridia bacterium]